MASSSKHVDSTVHVDSTGQALVPSRAQVVRDGHLPVGEFASDRAGAASPFGDDVRFPLPAERLSYVHPSEDAAPSPH